VRGEKFFSRAGVKIW